MPFALITGASAGLGQEFAKIFARRGYDLILVSRNLDKLNESAVHLRSTFNVRIETVAMDLSTKDGSRNLFDHCEGRGFSVEVLVNNAGMGCAGPFLKGSLPICVGMLELNIIALTELSWLFGNVMKNKGKGYILNVASIAAFLPGPYMAAYYASKAFVLSFSKALSFELAKHHVCVTALCPGPTRTEFFERAGIRMQGVKTLFLAPADKCALLGVEGLFKNQHVVIDGLLNRLMIFGLRFMPISFATWLAAKFMR